MSKKNVTLCLIFALCIILLSGTVLTACQPDSPAESSGSASDAPSGSGDVSEQPAGSKYTDADGRYTLANIGMPEFGFTQSEFRVAVTSNEQQTTYFSEEIGYDMYDTTDTVLNEAVKTRNHLIEQNYDVTVKAVPVKDVGEAITADVTVGLGEYDAAMPFMPACANLALQGMLLDLTSFGDYIHLDAPWWDQGANKMLSIGDHLYFTTGDISIMQKICSTAITFNKTMYTERLKNTYGDLYQLVRDHQWTIDKMHEMGKAVTGDKNGDGVMNSDDIFGLSSSSGDPTVYYLGSGERLIEKDANDLPSLYLGSTESSVNTVQKVLRLLEAGDEWVFNCEDYNGRVDDIWVLSLSIFGENRCLFRTTRFSAIKKLRNYEADFGIIPMPLINDTQEEYCTPCATTQAYGICIPTSAPNAEFSAYMIEALGCLAKNDITPAYYEVTLKHRDSKDAESEEMLDQYIFNHVVYEPGMAFNFSGLTYLLNDLFNRKSVDIVSTMESKGPEINKSINEFIEAYKANGKQ